MLAYVNEVQQRERDIGCDVLTHQKWLVQCYEFLSYGLFYVVVFRSGASYIDRIMTSKSFIFIIEKRQVPICVFVC